MIRQPGATPRPDRRPPQGVGRDHLPNPVQRSEHRLTERGTQMIIELLAVAAVATWLVLLPMRAVGRLGPRRGLVGPRPAWRPAGLGPALPETAPAPQGGIVVDPPAVEMPAPALAGSALAGPALAGAELVGAGHR